MESTENNRVPSEWQKQKAVLREKFKKLTDQDLNFDESRKNEMMGRLARKLGMTTREIKRIIDQAFS
jgi:uncharacterized protein YjbJ (UPF0337 family)